MPPAAAGRFPQSLRRGRPLSDASLRGVLPADQRAGGASGLHHAASPGQGGGAEPDQTPVAGTDSTRVDAGTGGSLVDSFQSEACGGGCHRGGLEGVHREAKGPLAALISTCLRGYQLLISPWLPSACRFHPTCSDYMRQAVQRHGAGRGVWLGLKRLGKCHPFHSGGCDPVP